MIGAPLLLLIGITGPLPDEAPLVAQVTPTRAEQVAKGVPQLGKVRQRKVRAVRRARRSDISETLRAMNLMNSGMEPFQPRTRPNN